ncbi:hypothetical protein KO525_18080 [Psychrosphaera sp. B3R10]|uniref:hypothetical protein n=1 Tax=unclassified Psychrosphaera TaxID=2641570 RepID=UPI001C0877AC|nr:MULTISPECIES: hypothetical protein [unclassified Psychrosphaera]MBU2882896.1 hypothetical protein [Psychrosphaera sp. I2R16]MBU2991293.1 hypothetical protein [Psychrosphaera sp. B3R10]
MTKALIILFILSFPSLANANVRFSGFGNLGIVASDSDYLAYRNNTSQAFGKFSGDLDFRTNSKLGLQLEWQGDSDFDAVVQVLLQENKQEALSDYFRLAFLRYKPTANLDIRLGRVPLDTFLITEYREVDYAFPWAKAPNEVYGIIPFYFVDGVDVSYTLPLDDFSFLSKIYTGSSRSNIGSLQYADLIEIANITGFSFELQSFNWMVSTKFSRGHFDENPIGTMELINGLKTLEPYWPDVERFATQFELKDAVADYVSIGGRYDLDNLTFYGELAEVSSQERAIADLSSGYFSATYRIDNFQIFTSLGFTNSGRYSFSEDGDTGLQLKSLPAQAFYQLSLLREGTESVANYYASSQRTVSIGGRWDISDSMALKLQLDRTDVDQGGDTLWLNNPDKSLDKDHIVHALFLNLSFIF